ncbi:serine-threonine protein kinase, putative [Bodo saltans]|uniref:non-specific serine/threonine protein kinase n=1 Tax=Bodo saltans TaxID=75058 RepID=A0A0S4IQ75_BODSA|nr:serine-threonine protein kinase, putative [Bodo saltans]|eukprot:CUF22180.1 serine-threonine protein kinase, putative [Bodo saltans]
MSELSSWCQCFPDLLIPEPAPNQMQPSVDVLGASPTQPDDKYYVRRVVGTGATGTALIGRRVRDGLPVIAKVVDLGELDATQRDRTNSEIDCLSRCQHSMIIQYLAHYLVDTRLLVVMELADAGDLGFQIKHRREAKAYFLEQEVALMLTQILIAVDYIHNQNILHRDLKPANVFVKTNGLVKIGDFGLSRIFEETVSKNVAQSVVGTPYYLAPEVWGREKYGKKVDMFSVGVLWYEMLTLQRPFKGSSVTSVMQAITNGTYAPLPDHISDNSRLLVAKLLAAKPEERFSVVEVFESPLMDHALRIFSSSIVNNLPATEAARQHVQRDALFLRAQVKAHLEAKYPVVAPSPARIKELAFSSPMVHLEDGKKWKHRALALTDNGLILVGKSVEALVTPKTTSPSPSPTASNGAAAASSSTSTTLGSMRCIPINDVLHVNDVPACFAEGRPNVFAIVLRSTDEALWFYSAIDESLNVEWKKRLGEACGRTLKPLELLKSDEEARKQ